MLWYILIAVIALIGAVLLIAAMKPPTFRIQRSAVIHAAPEKVFPLLNDFHVWAKWSPWEKLDPTLQRKYSGAPAGTGAVYEWEGNKKVGAGRMEILESIPNSKLKIRLEFLRPFKATNTAEFTLERQGDSTQVIWAMYGPSPFMSKVMCVFMNMDKLIGKDFEAGLANLNTVAQGA